MGQNICETPKCGTWTEYPRKRFCVDCERKHAKMQMIPCKVKGCTNLLRKGDNRKLCIDHTALPGGT